jgi:glycine oxidase
VVPQAKQNSDVLVIGGGAIGMAIARELKLKGAGKVTLVERGLLGREASFAAAGMLSVQCEAETQNDFFDLRYESRLLYDELAAELLSETGIDIELETSGTLHVAFREAEWPVLDSILSWQSTAGLSVEKLTREEILYREPKISPENCGGLYFHLDAQVDNRLLVSALAASIRKLGVEVFENVEVSGLTLENGRVTGARCGDACFSAPQVVLAAGAWSSLIKAHSDNRPPVYVTPVRGQMLSFSPNEKLLTHVVNTRDGYLVPRRSGQILAGATVENAGFDKSLTVEGEQYLVNLANLIAPALKRESIAERWAGLRPRAIDAFPVLGRLHGMGELYVATAHYRNGIGLTPITAKIVADEMLGIAGSKYCAIFGANRFVSAIAA